MRNRLTGTFTLLLLAASLPLLAQRPAEHGPPTREPAHEPAGRPRANQGHVPPPPQARPDRTMPGRPEVDARNRINSQPHVNHNEWFGHDRPDDPRFHLDRPYEHGHFERFGPSYRYNVVRLDPNLHRFWLPGGFFFEVAPFDWVVASDWCWTCGDDFVVYEDPDHPGWYLLYNVHTGAYVHVQYLGT